MSPDKGAHRAVAVAMEAGLPLKIAGKMQEPKEREYFHEFVEPHLVDGIEYLGEVTHGEKVELLQNARATLFPIEWEEPFGLVMIESMACGTPVIATRWGAVPEVIEHGRSGIIVDHYRQMAGALEEADKLDPFELRRYVEERVLARADGARLRRRVRGGDRAQSLARPQAARRRRRPAVASLRLEPGADTLRLLAVAEGLTGVAAASRSMSARSTSSSIATIASEQADVPVPAVARRAP